MSEVNVVFHKHNANAVKLLAPGWSPPSKGGLTLGVELELEVNPLTNLSDERTDQLVRKYGRESGVSIYGERAMLANAVKPWALIEDVLAVVGHDFAIGKRDGSLVNGVEFVSRPAALRTQMARWKRLCTNTPELAMVKPTCGLHVHVGRKGLTGGQIGQVVALTTVPSFKPWVTALAGRESANYAALNRKLKDGYALNPQKYEAINVSPKATIEFRLFAGTLKWEEMARRLEYVHAVLGWAKDVDLTQQQIEESGVERFVEWVQAQGKGKYPTLKAWTASQPVPKGKAIPVPTAPEGVDGELWAQVQLRAGTIMTVRSVEELLQYQFHYHDQTIGGGCRCVVCRNACRNILREHTLVVQL